MGLIKDSILGGPEKVYQVPEYKTKTIRCKEHGDYDAIVVRTPEGKEVHSDCPVCEHYNLQHERWHRYVKQQRIEAEGKLSAIFKESSIPKIFSNIGFNDFKSQGANSDEVKERMVNYAKNFSVIAETGACALLIGNTGTGKTMLAAAVANHVMNNGYTAFYTKCPRALSRVKNTWSKSVEETSEGEINKYRKPDILIIDEIPKGCRKPYDWEILHDILDRRTEDRKPTVSISTLSIEELKEKIGEEVFRRLHHKGAILEFNWDTYEEKHLF